MPKGLFVVVLTLIEPSIKFENKFQGTLLSTKGNIATDSVSSSHSGDNMGLFKRPVPRSLPPLTAEELNYSPISQKRGSIVSQGSGEAKKIPPPPKGPPPAHLLAKHHSSGGSNNPITTKQQ